MGDCRSALAHLDCLSLSPFAPQKSALEQHRKTRALFRGAKGDNGRPPIGSRPSWPLWPSFKICAARARAILDTEIQSHLKTQIS